MTNVSIAFQASFSRAKLKYYCFEEADITIFAKNMQKSWQHFKELAIL